MQFTTAATFLSLATTFLLSAPVRAGVNCEGSSLCGSDDFNCNNQPCPNFMLGEFNAAQLPGSTTYAQGQHIVCVAAEGTDGALCAFLKDGSAGSDASTIGPQWQQFVDHGCGRCGSIPMADSSQGLLTIDFVGGAPGCVGVC